MKKLKTKNLMKQAIFIIIVLMIVNFILPKNIYAVDTADGGSLMEVLTQFLCFIPDAVTNIFQEMFVSPENIQLEDGTYSIKYSPGVIFSGQVPALDINFIEPGESRIGTTTQSDYISLIDSLNLNGATQIYSKQYAGGSIGNLFVTKDEIIADIKRDEQFEYSASKTINVSILEGKLESLELNDSTTLFAGSTWDSETNTMQLAWLSEDGTKMYIVVDYFYIDSTIDMSGYASNSSTGIIYVYTVDTNTNLEDITGITGETMDVVVSTKEYKSSAAVLQSIVATWYKVLRRIALVGLLSAIVYIGIRILMTSTSAKDKAKYKSMLKDWVIAICLLFTLHYIMSITITVVDNINEVIKASSIAADGEDILMTNLRNKILNGESWSVVLTYVVIYFVLVIYTIIYTIQYIRRLIYIAFLTIVAPLITLTYPLDKIKDSKAQAFDMWIKDYIFFTLIQVVHLLIYYVFLGSAIDLTTEGYWLFAIVAIGFITPAEKLIKKMFGFEKSKTLGALGAGATGALIMNAIQKTPQGGGAKDATAGTKGATEGNATKGVRTAGANPFVNYAEDAQTRASITPNSQESSSGNGGGVGNPNGGSGSGSANSQTQSGENESASKLANLLKRKNLTNNRAEPAFSLNLKRKFKGAKAVAGRYFPAVAGGTIRLMAKTTGAVLGVSAAIAKGGEFKDLGTGIAAGFAAGDGAVNIVENGISSVVQIPEKVNDVVDTYREGAYGTEIARNARFDRAFRSSKEYKQLREESGYTEREFDKKVQKMLDAGIEDPKKMKKILKNHKLDPKRYSMDKAIKYNKLAEKCSDGILYNKVKFIRFCENNKLGLSEEDIIKLRKDIMNFK